MYAYRLRPTDMDLVSLHMLSSLLSTATEFVATLIALYCVVSFFSMKEEKSKKFVFISLFYFFLLVIILFVAAQLLINLSKPFHIPLGGVSALLGASLLHLCFGLVVIAIYSRIIISRIKSVVTHMRSVISRTKR